MSQTPSHLSSLVNFYFTSCGLWEEARLRMLRTGGGCTIILPQQNLNGQCYVLWMNSQRSRSSIPHTRIAHSMMMGGCVAPTIRLAYSLHRDAYQVQGCSGRTLWVKRQG